MSTEYMIGHTCPSLLGTYVMYEARVALGSTRLLPLLIDVRQRFGRYKIQCMSLGTLLRDHLQGHKLSWCLLCLGSPLS